MMAYAMRIAFFLVLEQQMLRRDSIHQDFTRPSACVTESGGSRGARNAL